MEMFEDVRHAALTIKASLDNAEQDEVHFSDRNAEKKGR
jgi:hypothetical protein